MSILNAPGVAGSEVTLKEKLGYGCGDLASNLVFQIIINFLMAYYTDTLLLDPARVAFVFAAVRLVDAVTDPMMGAIADRTKTKMGSFRPWILWLAVPFGVSYVLAFSGGGFTEPAKSYYAFATYFLLMLMYTAINIPYAALATAISPDPEDRMQLRSYQFAMAQTGNIIVGAATLPLVAVFGGGDDLKGFQIVIGIYSLLAIVLFIVCFFTTRERISSTGGAFNASTGADAEQSDDERQVSIWADLRSLFANDQWIFLSLVNFFLLIAVVMRGGATIYFANNILKEPGVASVYLTLGAISAVVGSVVASRFVGGFKPRDAVLSAIVGLAITALILGLGFIQFNGQPIIVQLTPFQILVGVIATGVGMLISHFVGRAFDRVKSFALIFGIQGLAHFAMYFSADSMPAVSLGLFTLIMFTNQVGVPIVWSMLSDCVDYGQYKTGIRNNGLVFSSALFSLKMGVMAAGYLGAMVLSRTGYNPEVEPNGVVLEGIMWNFTILPGIACLLVMFCGLRLKLTRAYVREIQAKIGVIDK